MKTLYPNEDAFNAKLATFIADGPEDLHLIADFDRTLSVSAVSLSLLRQTGYLGEDYAREAHALFKHYNAIENDEHLSLDEKAPFMKEWWERHFALLFAHKLTRQDIFGALSKGDVQLQKGTEDLLHLLSQKNIPLLVFSSGLGDMIREVLTQRALLTPNLHIAANFLRYNAAGHAVDVEGDVIHICNKKEFAVRDQPWVQRAGARKNVIVVGDSEADAHMAEGIAHDCVIKVGLLNQRIEEMRHKYVSAFDIVLEDCPSMEPILEMVQRIIGK